MTHRWKLPKGRSWPLRPAQLLAALDAGGVPHPSKMYRPSWPQYPAGDTRVLEVFWEPRRYGGGAWQASEAWAGGTEQVEVVIHNVLSDQRSRIEKDLIAVAVPQLVDWLRTAATAPEGWRIMPHRRTWRWSVGELAATGDDAGPGFVTEW